MLAKLIALVLPLGLDTFAVAAAIGMIGVSASARRRISLLFTGFEAGMPVIGLALGVPLGHAIGAAADYVAIGVLIAFGIYTLSSDDDNERLAELSQMRGMRAFVLGVSISLDELAIGFTLGLLHISAALVIALIAAQTLIVTQLGLRLGGRLSERVREGAERLAGLALATLGLVEALRLTARGSLASPDARLGSIVAHLESAQGRARVGRGKTRVGERKRGCGLWRGGAPAVPALDRFAPEELTLWFAGSWLFSTGPAVSLASRRRLLPGAGVALLK